MKAVATHDIKPKNTGFAETIAQKDALVYDLRAVMNDEQRYFIIKVARAKQAAFLLAVEKDAGLRLEDYGDILYRGWDEPENELKQLLRERYGMAYTEPPADGQEEQDSL